MLEKLKDADKVVGMRRLLRSLEAGEIREVYLADDVDLFILREVKAACQKADVRINMVDSRKELGKACGIDVPAAVAGIRK